MSLSLCVCVCVSVPLLMCFVCLGDSDIMCACVHAQVRAFGCSVQHSTEMAGLPALALPQSGRALTAKVSRSLDAQVLVITSWLLVTISQFQLLVQSILP